MTFEDVLIPVRRLSDVELGAALTMLDTRTRVDVAWVLGVDLASLDAAMDRIGWTPCR